MAIHRQEEDVQLSWSKALRFLLKAAIWQLVWCLFWWFVFEHAWRY